MLYKKPEQTPPTHFAIYGCGCYVEFPGPPQTFCPDHGHPHQAGYARIGVVPPGERKLTHDERKLLHGAVK